MVKGSGIYDHNSEIEISATPATGYFKEWSGGMLNDPTAPLTTIILNKDTNITASFERVVYTLQLNDSIGGTVSDGGQYYYGYLASISAWPDEGYKFMRWEGGLVEDQNIPYTTASMIADRNLTAIFEAIPLSDNLENTKEIAPDWYDSSWFGTPSKKVGGLTT